MNFLIAYVCGLPLGFFLSAFKKGKWWGKSYNDGTPMMDQEHENAVMFTIGYPFVFVYLFVRSFFQQLYYTFIFILNGTVLIMDKFSAWMKNYKEKTPIRVRFATPSPVVKAMSYRELAPKPCIACGALTSLCQEHIEVVGHDSEKENELSRLIRGCFR